MGLLDDILTLFAPPAEQYGTPSVTLQGEEVKSHGEKMIADFLSRNGVRYQYERPIEVGIWIFNEELCRPDFYLPDYDVYIEYWGMIDAKDHRTRREYRSKMAWKIRQFKRYAIKYVSVYPDNLGKLDWILRKRFEEVTGRSLPRPESSRPRTRRAGSARPPPRQRVPPVVCHEPRVCPPPIPVDVRTALPKDIYFVCAECGQNLVVDVAGAGLVLSCPRCGKPLTVPHAT